MSSCNRWRSSCDHSKREVKEVQQHILTKRKRIEEIENTERLFFKLPPELWEKILDNLESDDLFPLALSCRYFRQKQKELVARSRQSGPESGKPCLTLKTNLKRKLCEDHPASADYLRFCSKEKVLFADKNDECSKAEHIRYLAAFHGHLSLLQELLEPFRSTDPETTKNAGESSFPPNCFHNFCVCSFAASWRWFA